MTTVTTLSGDVGIAYSLNSTISDSDASAFWARLPENVAIALVKAAPKVAGPWVDNGSYFVRDDGDEGQYVAAAFHDGDWSAGHGTVSTHGSKTGIKSARDAADAHLRANGWLLESEVSP